MTASYSPALFVKILFSKSMIANFFEIFIFKITMYVYQCSGRNKDLKLVGRIFENRTFCRLLIAIPLKMYSRFGQPK